MKSFQFMKEVSQFLVQKVVVLIIKRKKKKKKENLRQKKKKIRSSNIGAVIYLLEINLQ